MSAFGSASGSGSGGEEEEFNCLEKDLLSSSNVTNTTHWTIRDNLHYSTPFVAAITILFFLIAFFWNLFIIVTFFAKYRLLKEPGNILLLNLAITDFLIALLVMLFSVVTEIAQEFVFGETDVVRCDVCATAGVFLMLLVQLSVHTLAVLSIDRFIHLTHPLRYNRLMTPFRAVVVSAGIWILCIAMAILPLVGFGQIEFNRNFGACLFRFTGDNPQSGIPNFYYAMLVIFWDLVPVTILISTNVYTYKFISKFLKRNFRRRSTYRNKKAIADNKKDDNKYHQQQRQLVKVFSALFIANIVSWSPVVIVVTLIIFIPADSLPDEVYTVGWLCYLTNPVFHPILESLFVKELRYQIVRAKRSVRRASTAIYSSTFAFRSKALDQANRAMEDDSKSRSTPVRQIHFLRRHNDNGHMPVTRNNSTLTEASMVDQSIVRNNIHSTGEQRLRRITFSEELLEVKELEAAYWESKENSSNDVAETSLQTGALDKLGSVDLHATIEVDVHEDSSSSAVEPDCVAVLSPDGEIRP